MHSVEKRRTFEQEIKTACIFPVKVDVMLPKEAVDLNMINSKLEMKEQNDKRT